MARQKWRSKHFSPLIIILLVILCIVIGLVLAEITGTLRVGGALGLFYGGADDDPIELRTSDLHQPLLDSDDSKDEEAQPLRPRITVPLGRGLATPNNGGPVFPKLLSGFSTAAVGPSTTVGPSGSSNTRPQASTFDNDLSEPLLQYDSDDDQKHESVPNAPMSYTPPSVAATAATTADGSSPVSVKRAPVTQLLAVPTDPKTAVDAFYANWKPLMEAVDDAAEADEADATSAGVPYSGFEKQKKPFIDNLYDYIEPYVVQPRRKNLAPGLHANKGKVGDFTWPASGTYRLQTYGNDL